MKEFVDEEMGEGGYRDASDYFNALLQEQLKRKAEQKQEGLLQEGLATESSAVDKKDWEFVCESSGSIPKYFQIQRVLSAPDLLTSPFDVNIILSLF